MTKINFAKIPKKTRIILFSIAGIILLASAGLAAFQFFVPYQPKSLAAQLTIIAETAQPIATLPAALAQENTATIAAVEEAASSSTDTSPAGEIESPTAILEQDITPQPSPGCANPDENGLCPVNEAETQTTPGAALSGTLPASPAAISTETSTTAFPVTPNPSQNPTQPPNTTPEITVTAVQAAIPAQIQTQTNKVDEAVMMQIPSGDFTMGSDKKSDPDYWGVEGPAHTVQLDSYWIYKTEVTNAMYQKCVAAETCTKPSRTDSKGSFYVKDAYRDYPVVEVTWDQAQAYCKWAGGSLPTEAQWEKAARGTDARRFPWGNSLPSGKLLNMCDKNCSLKDKDTHQDDGFMNLAPVGSFPDGASPYGLLDMAGNVWEWTADWYQPSYYKTSPKENPTGPDNVMLGHTIRGGSWSDKAPAQFRTVTRQGVAPTSVFDTLGFRCVVQ